MSLLLEALKKAERAKEEAQRRARGESAAATAEAPATERKAVMTRDKLPEITAPLEIVTEDLVPPPTASAARAPLEIAPDPEPAKPTPRGRAAPANGEVQAAARASAKKVFEAKFREPNPRMPFYVTVGVLGVFAVGTLVYFWYQLRPPSALVNLNPPRQAEAASAPLPEATPPAAAAMAVSAPSAIPGLPPTSARPAAPVPVLAAPVAAAPAARASVEPAVETPRLRPPEPRRLAPALPESATSVSPRTPPQVHPKVAAGYAAYAAGDLGAARSAYEEALREEPSNRDALLGLAALDVRSARYETAEALYLRALQIDPRDGDTQAALIALRSGRSDPLVTESRIKTLIAADPSAHALHFTLGNQLAAQSRWAEAQQEYFKAYVADPDNADLAYNLAVSLDHLHQRRQALEYYQRAISLGEKRGAAFDLTSARARAAQLAL